MWIHWCHLVYATELVPPSAYPSPQPKRQTARFSRFCTAHGRYFTMGAPSPPKLLLPTRIWTPSNTRFLWPNRAKTQTASGSVQLFLHRWTQSQSVPIQWDALSTSILPLAMGGSGLPSNTRFPEQSRVLNPNGISISSAVFAQMNAVWVFLYNGRPFPPQYCPLPWGDPDSHLIQGSLIQPSPQPKRHVDQFSCFCWAH